MCKPEQGFYDEEINVLPGSDVSQDTPEKRAEVLEATNALKLFWKVNKYNNHTAISAMHTFFLEITEHSSREQKLRHIQDCEGMKTAIESML